MDILLFLKSLLIGVSIAAPVGPIGLLCMQRVLDLGMLAGVVSGLGAATADALYGVLAAFGLTSLALILIDYSQSLALAGALFLIYLGVGFLKKQHSTQATVKKAEKDKSTARYSVMYSSTLLLTLANPITTLSFIAIFSSLSGEMTLTSESSMVMVLGVFLGSVFWWLTLCTVVALIKHKISAAIMSYVNKIAGLYLISFALWQLYKAYL